MTTLTFTIAGITPEIFAGLLEPWVQSHKFWEQGIYSWALNKPRVKHDMDCTRVVIETTRTNNETNICRGRESGTPRFAFEFREYKLGAMQIRVEGVPEAVVDKLADLLVYIADTWPETTEAPGARWPGGAIQQNPAPDPARPPAIALPTKPANLQRWQRVWNRIKRRQVGMGPSELLAWHNRTYEREPLSAKTMSKIIAAGVAGRLEPIKPT